MQPADLDRFLITGAGGAVGSTVSFGYRLTRQELDVTDGDQLSAALERLRPAGIVHLASVDLRTCERDPFQAVQVNVLATRRVAREARRRGLPFVLLSSGSIFSGPRGAIFAEQSEPRPVHVYGQTKLLAELVTLAELPSALIVRTSWLFGCDRHSGRFLDTLFDRLARNEPIKASDDQEGSPTYVQDMLGELRRLVLAGTSGVVHVANEGGGTAADVVAEAIRLTGSGSRLEITPAGQFNTTVRRSESEVLASDRVHLRPWQEALAELAGYR